MNRTLRTAVTFGAVCWTLSVVYFTGQAVVQSASARPYSMLTQIISDLGNTACGATICSPQHDLMNAIFLAVGRCTGWAPSPSSTPGR